MHPFIGVCLSRWLRTRIIKGKSLFAYRTQFWRGHLFLGHAFSAGSIKTLTLLDEAFLASLECTIGSQTVKIFWPGLPGSSLNYSICNCSHKAEVVCSVIGPFVWDIGNMTPLSYFSWFLLPWETSHILGLNTSSGVCTTALPSAISLHSISLNLELEWI